MKQALVEIIVLCLGVIVILIIFPLAFIENGVDTIKESMKGGGNYE